MGVLKTMTKHLVFVDLGQDVLPDLDLEVGPDAEDVAVEGGVVDLAERQPVGDLREHPRLPGRR